MKETPTKRPRKPVKVENWDGELLSSVYSSSEQTESSFYSGYEVPFLAENFAPQGYEQAKAEEGTGYLL